MKYACTLLAVSDVARSKTFYAELFDQTILLDLGRNVTFSGGFAIQQDFARLTGISEREVRTRPNNMELYFEVDDFDEFIDKLKKYPGVQYVHAPMMHEWKQRVVRIYDPDGHMIEIGESMAVIALRYLKEGYSQQETANIIQHPIAFVEAVKNGI